MAARTARLSVPEEMTGMLEENDRLGAGEGNRTLVCSLGSCRSAIELRPHIKKLDGIRRAFHLPFVVPFRADDPIRSRSYTDMLIAI
jgi:hypothetical protein